MALQCRGAQLHPQPPGSPAAIALADDKLPPRSAAARKIDCPPRCQTRSCPCAIARPVARHAPPHCWSAPRHPPAQTSTAPPTASSALGTAPPLFGRGSPARAAAVAPVGLGAAPAV